MTAPVQLPGILREIADAAGVEAALLIAREKGGGRASFSPRPRDDHWSVRLLGRERADKVARALTGNRLRVELDVPLGPSSSYAKERINRATAMKAALDAGLSFDASARAAGVDRSTIRRFKSRVGKRSSGRQGNLF
jgi:hypothetical protein